MTIGLGNVWRFPFTAYENGGGAFLIPYIIVLFLIGNPIYYLEMIIGQFTNRSSIKAWSVAPGFRGIGVAQTFSMVAIGSYYCALMALVLYYFIHSFQFRLPWAECRPEWEGICFSLENSDSTLNQSLTSNRTLKSSAELYFS